MNTKPSIHACMQRLRLDDSLFDDLDSAINEAHAEALMQLDRAALHPDAAARTAAVAVVQAELDAAILTEDAAVIAAAQAEFDLVCTGIAVTEDIISAQLLLVDVRIGSNTGDEVERKQRAAEALLFRHRRLGV